MVERQPGRPTEHEFIGAAARYLRLKGLAAQYSEPEIVTPPLVTLTEIMTQHPHLDRNAAQALYDTTNAQRAMKVQRRAHNRGDDAAIIRAELDAEGIPGDPEARKLATFALSQLEAYLLPK